MKRFLLIFVVCFSLGSMLVSWRDEKSDGMPKEELQQELDKVKALLENNTKILNVVFEGNRTRLTFADGSVFETKVPDAIVPQIGSNGNWFVNGVDLGVSAEAKVPTIGSNGNWWVDGKDTGVKAQGGQGEAGEKGDPGMAIEDVMYDITTGILKIILTNGNESEYILSASEGCMVGYLIKGLNGEFVLSTIYNGDLPFAQFKYDAKNNLIEGEYYINVLNTPKKWLGFEQKFDVDGKIKQQFIKEYAEIDKAIPVGNIFPEDVNTYETKEVIYTAEKLFDEFFPNGIQGYNGGKGELMDKLSSVYCYNDDYVYRIINRFNNNNGAYSFRVIKESRKTYVTGKEKGDKYFCLMQEAGKVYLCTPCYSYYRDEVEYAYNETRWNPYFYIEEDYYDLSSVEIIREDPYYWRVRFAKSDQLVNMAQGYKLPAVPYTDKVDEVNGNELLDYFVPDPDKILVEEGITGNYKALFYKFNLYDKGDEMKRGTLNYVYLGDDYEVALEGEEVGNVVMAGGKIQKVVVVDEKKEKLELLKFNYTGDLLTTIDAPYAKAIEVAKILYDNKNNPVEFQVNSSKLKGLGYEKILNTIGLIYEYDYYDEEKGCVVRGYKYSEGYVPLLKIAYNYNMKNLMNRTLLAIHPILSLIQTNNAIEKLIWAGHSSCFAEYSDYNEGGYPRKVKGILHYAPFVNDDNIFESQNEYPANESVATMYRLKYEKKK